VCAVACDQVVCASENGSGENMLVLLRERRSIFEHGRLAKDEHAHCVEQFGEALKLARKGKVPPTLFYDEIGGDQLDAGNLPETINLAVTFPRRGYQHVSVEK
jgi:hypothetical protein